MCPSKKKVLMIYTGGTIGMVPGEHGYTPSPEALSKALENIRDLNQPTAPTWELLEFHPLLDSSDITVKEWNKIGRTIAEHYASYDGFVVLHGTDTMAYTAAALSFMLENLDKPVILTGAQIPLCEMRSDGYDNIINSVLLAASDKLCEVCLYFNGTLLRGNRSTKLSSDRLGAFDSPNYPHLAECGIQIQFHDQALLQPQAGPFRLQEFEEIPIGVLKVFPGIQLQLFESIMTKKLHGVVLETFGAGNIPSSQNALLPVIEKAHRSGCVLTVCSQCPQGAVSLGTYETSQGLIRTGAVSGHDMTTEAAVAKLYYLFSRYADPETVKEKMGNNLRGELTQ